MNEVVAKLSPQHLQEWREVCARRDAVANNPTAFTAEEAIRVYMDYFGIIYLTPRTVSVRLYL